MTGSDIAGTGELDPTTARRLLDALSAALGPGPIVDIGGGAGVVTAGLNARGVPTVIVDRYDHRVPGEDVPLLLADAVALPLRSHTVSGVHMARVLAHVGGWRSATGSTAVRRRRTGTARDAGVW